MISLIKQTPSLSLWRRGCKVFALGFVFLVLSGAAQAAQQSPAAQAHTTKALQLMARGQWQEAKGEAIAAHDALASKLYYWMLFTKKDDFSPYLQLTRFIRQNPEWPGVEDLKVKVEKNMPDELSAPEIIGWFRDYPPVTASGVNRYASALIDQGRAGEARAFLSDWWATTNLSEADQKLIFRKYRDYLDRDAHLRRFDAMLLRGQSGNPVALAEVLGGGYPELAAARIALAKDDPDSSDLIARVPKALQRDAGLLFERLRFRRKNDLDEAAIAILKHPPSPAEILNPKDWWKERHIMIRRLLEKKDYQGAYALASGHTQVEGAEYAEAEWLAGWLALRYLRNPAKAYEHFTAMYKSVQTPLSQSRGAYWAGRAGEAAGDKKSAMRWYQDAARFQTVFYGQLAASHIGMDNALPHAAAPKLEASDLAEFKANDLMQVFYLFQKAGMGYEGRKFLKAFVAEDQTPKRYRYAAERAADTGDLLDAVKISKDATSKGMFLTAQSYPVITPRLEGIELEWSLVHAIIRQESMFDFDARSPVGALGLMQLMPATAQEVAGKMGRGHDTAMLTADPNYNIQLGSQYLSDLVRRFDDSYPLAIAGYNAGPGRVDQWLETFGDPRTGQIDLVDWIEMIPISETRNYVQRVMEGVYVYRLRLKNVQKSPTVPIHVAKNLKNKS